MYRVFATLDAAVTVAGLALRLRGPAAAVARTVLAPGWLMSGAPAGLYHRQRGWPCPLERRRLTAVTPESTRRVPPSIIFRDDADAEGVGGANAARCRRQRHP